MHVCKERDRTGVLRLTKAQVKQLRIVRMRFAIHTSYLETTGVTGVLKELTRIASVFIRCKKTTRSDICVLGVLIRHVDGRATTEGSIFKLEIG